MYGLKAVQPLKQYKRKSKSTQRKKKKKPTDFWKSNRPTGWSTI